MPPSLIIDHIEPLMVGDTKIEHLSVRVYNEDSSFAPAGHTVVQMMLGTDYEYWATRGSRYNAEKDALGARALERLDAYLPGIKTAVEMTDLATPLTFWGMARSWRGAYEGWMPSSDSLFGHVKKTLPGLSRFYETARRSSTWRSRASA